MTDIFVTLTWHGFRVIGKMSQRPRQIFTPRKRKAWESCPSLFKPSTPEANSASKIKRSAPIPAAANPVSQLTSNRLLAGYMAHEFLSKGTLFGQSFDPARLNALPVKTSSSAELKRVNSETHRSYGDVASILMSDEIQIPGIVNPTQLTRWMQT